MSAQVAAIADGVGELATADPSWAWAAYEPSPARPWTPELAAHLLRRSGFGVRHAEWKAACKSGPAAAVGRCLGPPAAESAERETFRAREAAAAQRGGAGAFTAWWLRRMAETAWPLGERLTLVWHDQFAIAAEKVGDAALYQRHVEALREHVGKPLASLFTVLMDDPAVFLGLGGAAQRKAAPNQVFARAWLEHHTLGPGVAAEADILAVARVFSGCFVNGGRFRFNEREHVAEPQTVLGVEGVRDRMDLAPILASHPATGRQVARRLFRALVSEAAEPGEAMLRPLSEMLVQGATLLDVAGRVMRSNLFFSAHAVGQRVLSPVELAIGLSRTLEVVPPTLPLVETLARLGQRLESPPTTAGWTGGADWLNNWTLPQRVQLGRRLIQGGGELGDGVDVVAMFQRNGLEGESAAGEFWQTALLPGAPAATIRERMTERARGGGTRAEKCRHMLTELISEPEAQLG